jgi:hypothetical protein
MTEEELSLRLKSAFPAAPPAGAALHARVEGKERDARRGIGRKRRGRATFATLGVACVLTPVALQTPVMYILYRNFHCTPSRTSYWETFNGSDSEQKSRSWYSGKNYRIEDWKKSKDGSKGTYTMESVRLRKGNKFSLWKIRGTENNPAVVLVSNQSENSGLTRSLRWLMDSWQAPLLRLGQDRVIDGVACKELFREETSGSRWQEFFSPMRHGKVIFSFKTYYDIQTGRLVRMESWMARENGDLKLENRSQAYYNVPVPDSLFDAPHDPNLVQVKPF